MPVCELSDGESATFFTSCTSGPASSAASDLRTALSTEALFLPASSAASTCAGGGGASTGAPNREELAECRRNSGLGRRAAPVPSTVVTTRPPRAHTGRRQELMARCSGSPASSSQRDRMTVQPPQPPWPHGFFGPARETSGERR